MGNTRQSVVRMGFVQSKSGHWTLWCAGVLNTIRYLNKTQVRALKTELTEQMRGKSDSEQRSIFRERALSRV